MEKAKIAKGLGADHAIVGYEGYAGRVREITEGRGADVVYDSVGRDTFDESLKALRKRGMLVLFGASSGPVPPVDLQQLNKHGSLYVTRPTVDDYCSSPEQYSDGGSAVRFSAHPGHEALGVDDDPLMVSFADEPFFVEAEDSEVERAGFDADEFDCGGDFHPHGRCRHVADVHVGPHRVLALAEERPECLDARLFDEADHHGRGEDRGHVRKAGPARFHCRHGMALLDGHVFGVLQPDRQFLGAHIVPTLILIGQQTRREPSGSPHSSESSPANVCRISSWPASLTARTADQVEM
ncbi:zinc-binding dehydrogenase [Arthrobacter sp. GN70]|nr:zinc-binding dehydrogenase [Arthrobacter sp. GN70]